MFNFKNNYNILENFSDNVWPGNLENKTFYLNGKKNDDNKITFIPSINDWGYIIEGKLDGIKFKLDNFEIIKQDTDNTSIRINDDFTNMTPDSNINLFFSSAFNEAIIIFTDNRFDFMMVSANGQIRNFIPLNIPDNWPEIKYFRYNSTDYPNDYIEFKTYDNDWGYKINFYSDEYLPWEATNFEIKNEQIFLKEFSVENENENAINELKESFFEIFDDGELIELNSLNNFFVFRPTMCANGITRGNICCDSICGICGGSGCSSRNGRKTRKKCCESVIKNSKKLCNTVNDVACIIPDSNQDISSTDPTPSPDLTPTPSTDLTPKPSTDLTPTPVPEKCKGWCKNHPEDWEEKCNWKTKACSACYECSDDYTPVPEKCEGWCKNHPEDWEGKCNWKTKACSACSECPTPTPFMEPTPTPFMEPTPTPFMEPTPTPFMEPTPTPFMEPTPTPFIEQNQVEDDNQMCLTGIARDGVCCASECGRCGGSDCQDLPSGRNNCCITTIQENNRFCSSYDDVGCIIPDSTRNQNINASNNQEVINNNQSLENELQNSNQNLNQNQNELQNSNQNLNKQQDELRNNQNLNQQSDEIKTELEPRATLLPPIFHKHKYKIIGVIILMFVLLVLLIIFASGYTPETKSDTDKYLELIKLMDN